jgi:uncharacterized membrane protein YedE/YeeE
MRAIRLMFDILQTLANGCTTGSTVSCITLAILWIILIVGATNVLCTLFNRTITVEEKKDDKS